MKEKIEFIDELLTRFEDWMHGKDGEDVTTARYYLDDISKAHSKNDLWVKGEDGVPSDSDWYVCIVNGKREVMKFNFPNKFWMDFTAKPYKPNEIEKWLNS